MGLLILAFVGLLLLIALATGASNGRQRSDFRHTSGWPEDESPPIATIENPDDSSF